MRRLQAQSDGPSFFPPACHHSAGELAHDVLEPVAGFDARVGVRVQQAVGRHRLETAV